MADAGDDTLVFLRFWDTEEYDSSRISIELGNFTHILNEMYVKGKVAKCGFSGYIDNLLATPIVIRGAVLGSPKTIGGSTPTIK